MIAIENVKVYNIARAVYSARNAMNSWDKSDSDLDNDILGEHDLALAQKLYKAGTEHRKYLRQISVSMDITAPLYWWKEFDTYKVGTTSNSCSTMHKIAEKEFELDDFSYEQLSGNSVSVLNDLIDWLNLERREYNRTKSKAYWWQMIQLLPSSYNQKRTITMNYENVANIIHQRKCHKLDEWVEFCHELEKLPYVSEIMCEG